MSTPAPPPDHSAEQSATVAPVHYRSPRQEYRRARTRSQTVVFGASILGLAIFFLLGFLGISGALPLPFGDDFSKKDTFAEVGDIPCPRPGARAGSPDGISVRVLNTTSTPGLAATVATMFEKLGYTISGTDNAPTYHGLARIEAGPRGVDAAYTLARYFPEDVRIVLTAAEDDSLTVVLGNKYEILLPVKERNALRDTPTPLIPAAGCLPVAEPAGGWAVPEELRQSGAQSGDEAEDDEEEAEAG